MIENLYEIRKELHKIPELGFKEFKTTDFILNILRKVPKIKIKTFTYPGILVEYTNADTDEYIMFRADMDALPIMEKTGCNFESLHKGLMHACGHDIHMTILMGLIDLVVKKKTKKNILFLFQPAEEGNGGAERMINDGIFEPYNVSEAYALHVTPDYPAGYISSNPGIIFGIPTEINIHIKGKSSHAALYENGNDAIAAGIKLYDSFTQLLSKKIPSTEPYLFHIGKISGGDARNIVSDECLLEGTVRCFNVETKNEIFNLMEKTGKAVDLMYGTKTEIEKLISYDPVINDKGLYLRLKKIASDKYNFIESKPLLTGEDFGFFTGLYKGLLFWLGAKDKGEGLHTETFLPSEKCIDVGIDVFFDLIKEDKD